MVNGKRTQLGGKIEVLINALDRFRSPQGTDKKREINPSKYDINPRDRDTARTLAAIWANVSSTTYIFSSHISSQGSCSYIVHCAVRAPKYMRSSGANRRRVGP